MALITAVIFDLDQTLLNRTATFTRFLEQQYARFQNELKAIQAKQYISAILSFDNNGYTSKQTIYAQLCREWGLPIEKQLLDDFHENYGSDAVLNEGAIDVLGELSRSRTLGLITNGRSKAQNGKIDSAVIRHFFKAIKISEAEGIKKPDPRIFERCLHDLGVTANQAVYIGDHPDNDVAAAQKVGMKGIWVANAHYDRPMFADGVIQDLAELPSLITAFSP